MKVFSLFAGIPFAIFMLFFGVPWIIANLINSHSDLGIGVIVLGACLITGFVGNKLYNVLIERNKTEHE